jgi:hypothetical protein
MTTVYITLTNETKPRVIATSFWRAVAEGYAKRYNDLAQFECAHVLQINVPEVKS